MGKRLASATLIATLALGFLTLAAPAAHALSTQESQFVSLINKERTSRGIKSLTVKSDLVSVARRHSERMAAKGSIWHNNNLPNEVSGNWTALGENVGMGPTVDSLHKAFMNSPGHRANILDREYNQIGVGVVVKDGTIYVTEVFAARASTTTTATKTTTTRTTTTKTTTASKPRSTTTRVASAPKPAPRPAAPAPVQAPRTVDMLVQLVGMDAPQVDPTTGAAMGI